MSDRAIWKMIYLLYNANTPTLSLAELNRAGIVCYPDSIQPAVDTGLIEFHPPDQYSLRRAGRDLLRSFAFFNRRWSGPDLWVDYPEAFVIMPFSQPWSNEVYETIIKPAVESAGLACERGDSLIRVGDLTQNIWNQIMRAGIIIAEVSIPNVNVFYELGIVHATGKDALLFKQIGASLAALTTMYDPKNKESAKSLIQRQIENWATANHAHEVHRIYDSSSTL